ncbi:hypothetical protein [Actinoplanes sp. NPDC051494]
MKFSWTTPQHPAAYFIVAAIRDVMKSAVGSGGYGVIVHADVQ